MEAGWLFGLVVTPLFFNIYSSRVFEPDKIALLRSLALITLAAWLVKIVEEGGLRFHNIPADPHRSLRGFFRLPLALPVAAFAAVYLVATLFSVTPYTSWLGSYQRMQATFTTYSYLVLFAAVAANVRRRAQVERILTTVIITSLPVSLYGILQHYHLDPLPWGGDTVQRVTGNMGNAIFLAAYLILSFLIALGRSAVTAHTILTEEAHAARHMVRLTGYVIILALNAVAIWFTQSRGPLAGLAVGLFFFAVLIALYWGKRWHATQPRLSALANGAALLAIGLTLAGAAFLVALNLPNGPFQSLRDLPTLGRLAQIGDEIQGRTGTGRVRVLIWQGVVELMTPHTPLQYPPDGRADPWNAIRPLIGYGPEGLYVAYNRFYPPELGQIEARNASPDRSHNETFDALAFTGVIGLATAMGLYVAVFYYSLKWLGFVDTPGRRNVLLGLIFGGGAASTTALVRWQGPEFFGVGLPFGMLIGLSLFLLWYGLLAALRGLRPDEPGAPELHGAGEGADIQEPWRAIALISLFAAIVAHVGEIHFGIAIVSTRTHFWMFTGLLIVLGFVWPKMGTANAPSSKDDLRQAAPAFAETARAARRRQRAQMRRRSPPGDSAQSSEAREFWPPILVAVAVMAVVLFTLGFDFISNSLRSQNPLEILSEAFTALKASTPAPGAPPPELRPFGVLILIAITWVIGSALAYLEEAPAVRREIWLEGMVVTALLALVIGATGWMLIATRHADIASVPVDPQKIIAGVLGAATSLAALLSLYYVIVFVFLLGAAALLPAQWPTASRASFNAPAAVAYTALAVTAVFLSMILNLQVIQADIIYKTGLQFDDGGQPDVAIPLYDRVLSLAPAQDYYYLFLGRAFLNRTAALADPAERKTLYVLAESKLQEARDLNPLNTDHTANLARINRQWAAVTRDADPAASAEKAARSGDYYTQALALSPHNAGLWNEWALLSFQLLGDGDAAQSKLDESFRLDKRFPQTYEIQGNLEVWRASTAADEAQRQAYFQKAFEAYVQGIEVAAQLNVSALNLRLGLASAYAQTGQFPSAVDQYLLAVPEAAESQKWQIYQAVAELYRQMGDAAQAINYGQLALGIAPEANKPQLQAWLDALTQTP
jgi:hypothetical protein